MKKNYLISILFFAVAMQGCLKEPEWKNVQKGDKSAYFDFATTVDINLTVDYHLADYMVDFAVYGQDPFVTVTEDGLDGRVFDEDLRPLFRAITNSKGRFEGTMNIPTCVNRVWIYSKYFGVPTLVTVYVTESGAIYDNVPQNRASSRSRASYGTAPGDVNVLASWDDYGVPSNMATPPAVIPARLYQNLMHTLPNARNISIDHPDFLGRSSNIILKDSSVVDMVFVHDGGDLTSSIGYYWYKTSDGFNSATIRKTLLFPNASYANGGGNIATGDRVALKFKDPQTGVWGDKFPGGYTVGFFIYPHGFNGGVNGNPNTKTITEKSMGVFYSNYATGRQQSLLLKDPTTFNEENKDVVILAFEDWPRQTYSSWQDNDYNDVIMLVRATKGTVDTRDIPDIVPDPSDDPKPDPKDNYLIYEGTLAFEDLWPSKGDYDMNDVVLEYTCTVMRDINNNVTGLIDSIRPRWSGAEFHNGFGYQFDNVAFTADPASINVTVRTNCGFANDNGYFQKSANGLELGQTKAVIMLFEDIKPMTPNYKYYYIDPGNGANSGRKPKPDVQYYFTVVTNFGGQNDLAKHPKLSDIGAPPYNPFTVVTDRNDGATFSTPEKEKVYRRAREIHLPYFAPTKKAIDMGVYDWFYANDDKSRPGLGYYYVSNEDYPWGINIPKIFNFPKESKKVDDVEFGYPRFANWVSSRGAQDADWYNHPGPQIGVLE